MDVTEALHSEILAGIPKAQSKVIQTTEHGERWDEIAADLDWINRVGRTPVFSIPYRDV